MKKGIIHPTDFSECADNALDYAIVLAKKLECKLEVIHLLDYTDINSNEYNARRLLEEVELKEKKAKRKLRSIENKVEKHDVKLETTIHSGKIKSLLPEYLVKQNLDMVVMGTTGANKLVNKLMGSNTYKIIEVANQPVLAVPKNAKLKKFKKIVFLSDYNDKDIKSVEYISKIAKCFESTIDVVHILDDDTSKKINNQKLLDNFQSRVKEEVSYKNINYQLLYSKNTLLRIQTLIKETKPDLIALVMRKQNFLERLFFGSLTEKMVYQIDTPILVFPE